MDAEPGRLTPIALPSLWAQRITIGTIFEPLLRYVPSDGHAPARYAARLARSWRVMPDGLEAGMNEQDVADLIEFLRRPDRTLFTQAK